MCADFGSTLMFYFYDLLLKKNKTNKALKPNPEVIKMFEWFTNKADFRRDEDLLKAVKGGWADGSTWPTASGWLVK